ncbi:MAG: zf-HC2 domain-containing protein [Candidatus Riflebacteria bacterium]|nr:zf-HC2 domain-containing protein [Candidatus Riflebacteria bacterium]
MNCESCKDLLLTEYIDNEITPVLKDEVDAHLQTCMECRLFHCRIEHEILNPFLGADSVTPPRDLWQNVKASLETSKLSEEDIPNSVSERDVSKVRYGQESNLPLPASSKEATLHENCEVSFPNRMFDILKYFSWNWTFAAGIVIMTLLTFSFRSHPPIGPKISNPVRVFELASMSAVSPDLARQSLPDDLENGIAAIDNDDLESVIIQNSSFETPMEEFFL